MTQQRLHSSLAPIDVLTREELDASVHRALQDALRQRYLGVGEIRFPRIAILATGATVNVGAVSNNEVPCGPEQGDFWIVRRMIVKSNNFADTAKYILFRGSTPSDIANAYGPVNLLEGFTAAGAGQSVGVGFYPTSKSISLEPGEQIYALVTGATAGNIYFLDGEALRVPAEMKAKLLS